MLHYTVVFFEILLIAAALGFLGSVAGAHQPARRSATDSRNRHRMRKNVALKDMQEIWRITRHVITGTLLCAVLMSGWLLLIEQTEPSAAAVEQLARLENKDSSNPSE
jgi:hypothetical protein